MGCANVMIPSYIRDKNPYQKAFYASFNKTRTATIGTLKNAGWAIEKEVEPKLFERERALDEKNRQTLLFTEIRQASFLIGSGFARINVYLRETATNETDVEIRYVNVTTAMFKSFYGYRNDQMIDRILKDIEATLDL